MFKTCSLWLMVLLGLTLPKLSWGIPSHSLRHDVVAHEKVNAGSNHLVQTLLSAIYGPSLRVHAFGPSYQITQTASSGSFTAEALDFNAFVRDNVTFNQGDIDGPVAIGNNLVLAGTGQMAQQSVGTWTHNGLPIGLMIDRTVIFSSGSGINLLSQSNLLIGITGPVNIYDTQNNTQVNTQVSGGSYNSNPRILMDHHQPASSIDIPSGTLIDFDDIFSTFRTRSTAVGQLPNDVSLSHANGYALDRQNLPNNAQVYINQLATGDNILNVDATNLNRIQTMVFGNNGRPSASQRLIINVDAPGNFNWNNFNFSGIGSTQAPYILLNFPATTTLNINASQTIEGTVFAPDAYVFKNNSANIEGQVIAESYRQGGGELHYFPYEGDIPAAAQPTLTAPSAPTCASGNVLWQNHIDFTNLSGSYGIPQADVRLKDASDLDYVLPITLPADFAGAVEVTIEEAISWDGYLARSGVNTQAAERWKVAFFLGGVLQGESSYTDDLTDGVTSAEWSGSLGSISLPNGADEVRIIHYEHGTYGSGSVASANSVVPSSICISYAPVQPPVQDLLLTSMCSDDPSVERRWRVRNANAFSVDYTYEVVGTTQTGSLLAPTGDSYFVTQTVGGANTTRITWLDAQGNSQQTVKASGGAICPPPPCTLTDGGQIGSDQTFCVVKGEKVFPDTIHSVSAPGGSATYEWYYSFDPTLPYDQWVQKKDEHGPSYVPNGSKKTFALVRRVRLCPTEPWVYSNVVTITINYTPEVAFAYVNDTCLNGERTMIFTAEKISGATYAWAFPGANDPSGAPVDPSLGDHQVMTSYPGVGGSFQASLTISHGDCDSTLTLDVMVDPCSGCDNVTDGGLIAGTQASCVLPYDPSPVGGNVAVGGTGNLTYTWYHTENPSLPVQMWNEVVGYSGKNYNPDPIDTTTYYLRSAMRDGCLQGKVSNIIGVEVSANVQTLCKSWELYSQPHGFDLTGVTAPGYEDRYRWNALREGGSLTSYGDDRARLQGTLVSLDHANQQWFADLNTQPRMDWMEWQTSGHPMAGNHTVSGIGGDMDHYTWDYYAIDGSNSYLFGLDIFEGDTLVITGGYAQRGMGANGINDVNGIYAEFSFTSTSGLYSGTAVFRNKFTQCIDVCPATPQVAARVMLEGAYQSSTGLMRTTLATNGLLPLSQPFNRAPWNYAGTESVPVLPSDSLVDWVLIQLRDAADSSLMIHQMAAFLKANGDIVDTDGNSLAEAYLPVDDRAYYVVLSTRNHLSIMASAEVNKMGRVYLYNFTTTGSIYTNGSTLNAPATEIGPGIFGMTTGDAANNRAINSLDLQRIALAYFQAGYLDGDLDLNGVINSLDLQRAALRYFQRSHVPNQSN
jgi:choice-of-anchor A domain-containing protein